MKRVIFFIIHLFVIGFSIWILINQIFYAPEKDYPHIIKASLILLSYFLAVTGIRRRETIFDYTVYEEVYRDDVKGAFAEDKRNYRKFFKAVTYYERDNYKKALKLFNKLEDKCVNSKDYVAVLLFKALCYEEQKRIDSAIKCYEELVRYEAANARAWSNLGLLYVEKGNFAEAYRAYSNAIMYDPKYAPAYCNMANYYVKQGDGAKIVEYALQAIELDSNLYQAMSAASVGYKMLGDDANAQKYMKMYSVNGGSGRELKKVLKDMS